MSQAITEAMVEAALSAYREGIYLTDEQVLSSVTKIVSAALSAGQAQPGYLKLPTNADEAELMEKTGFAWLKAHAPERLVTPAVPGEVQVKHKKRGSVYDVIGVGRIQAESWIDEARPAPVDMREVTIYRSVDDGALWVRPREEFEDGRFEALSVPLPEIEGGDKGDGWQPIETAPKNKYVLLFRPNAPLWQQVTEGKWDDQGHHKKPRPFWACPWRIASNDGDRDHAPTHWQPLPAAPSASIEGETKP